jgi:CheY-like chemotaxis protein
VLLKDKHFFYFLDDRRDRSIFRLILRRNGGEVKFEYRRKDAVRCLGGFMPIDVILVDLISVEDLSGYDLFDMIRQEPAFAHIPIVAISAADPLVEMQKSRAKGFNGYLSKPIHIIQFPQHVLTIISGERVWQTV